MGKYLHQGHRERMRTRFLTYGADALCEHELMELILFFALPRVNTNETAHRLLDEWGSISGVLSAEREDLMKINGVGSAAADFLCLLSEICNEYTYLSADPPQVLSEGDLIEYFCGYFNGAVQGLCLLICLSDQLKIVDKLSFTMESVIDDRFEIRRTVERLIRCDCRKIAVGINRPDKLPIPDHRDFLVAKMFAQNLTPLDISLADCVICSSGRAFSMKENGAFSFLS